MINSRIFFIKQIWWTHLLAILLFCTTTLFAQKEKTFEVKSPDGAISIKVTAGAKLEWSVQHQGKQIIASSSIAMILGDGSVLGDNASIISSNKDNVDTKFNAINYKRAVVIDKYNQLTINCKNDFGVIFRVYNDAVAYRFFTKKNGELIIKNEEANFNFTADHNAFIPIQWDYRGGQMFNSSFEALYHEIKLSQFPKDSLAFLPLLVDVGQNMKAEILEADLEDYPGMYMDLNRTGKGLKGVYAPYPLEAKAGGYGTINLVPTKRADYIAKTQGTRSFPWRAVIITTQDKDLMNCDIVQKLATPNKLKDISWIKAGQVAWDWWNDWNISGVDFKAGQNTATYKYFIDFAALNKIPYIIVDGGWSVPGDLSKARPGVDLTEIIAYGNKKNVEVIVWASWQEIIQQMEKVFPYYEKIGVRGMKIDFIDRDDQVAVKSLYDIAELAAKHKLIVDYHGSFKPTGLQRTYPNVVGYEGVKGLENYKWANEDQPRYCVTIPFIRNVAGPMDYTPGAMRNSIQANYRAINSMPMSKGTRTNQLAMYVVFEVPFQMLSDNPTIYMKEQECTDFITQIPAVTDETVPLDGKVGEYVAVARKKGNTWYVGAMTNWTPRELILDFSFLEKGNYKAEVFTDGVNADRDATDYKKVSMKIKAGDKVKVNMAPGGGWAARIEKVK
jgi:alpha-glucosidase